MELISIGKIDLNCLKEEFGDIRTDEIIITDERIAHIKSHHPQDYELFERLGRITVTDPDIVIRDIKNEGTVFMVKRLSDTNLNVVCRLALQSDRTDFKNSVMTFYRIRQKNLRKLENKNKVLYKKE